MAKAKKVKSVDWYGGKEFTGFMWARYENGVMMEHGEHTGTTLDGKDADMQLHALDFAIPMSAMEDLYKGNGK